MRVYNLVESLAGNPFVSQDIVDKYLKQHSVTDARVANEYVRTEISAEEGESADLFACETKVVSWD